MFFSLFFGSIFPGPGTSGGHGRLVSDSDCRERVIYEPIIAPARDHLRQDWRGAELALFIPRRLGVKIFRIFLSPSFGTVEETGWRRVADEAGELFVARQVEEDL